MDNGTAGDAIGITANGMNFTTKDRDNDWYIGNRAVDTCAGYGHGGGWWYKNCGSGKLNSPYNGTHAAFNWLQMNIDTDPMKLSFSRMTLIQK